MPRHVVHPSKLEAACPRSCASPAEPVTAKCPRSCSPRMPWTPAMIAALVTTLPIGVVLLSVDGSVVYANDAGRPLWAKAHASASPSALDAVVARALLAREVVRDQQISVDPCPAGSDRDWPSGRHLLVNATPLCAARDEMEGLLLTIEDVSARREMERFRPMIESIARL